MVTTLLAWSNGQASAIMFHHRSSDWLETLPTNRSRKSWQRWVLYNRESSWWTPKGDALNEMNDLINWTMGFRRDNDIAIPTAVVSKKQFKEGFDPYILPPGSFIDAGQFSSVSALVAFLQKVGTDTKLYSKYFEWRREWDIQLISENEGQEFEDFNKDYFCPLCIKLHEDHQSKFIGNFQEWYEQEKCKEYPKMNP